MRGTPHGGIIKTKAALAAAPDAMKRPAALSAGQPPKFDNDHRAFHGNLRRPCTDTGQQMNEGASIGGPQRSRSQVRVPTTFLPGETALACSAVRMESLSPSSLKNRTCDVPVKI